MSTNDTPAPILSARGLRHSFGQTEALRGIDLDVHAGEVLAVMGPSGSGKSTLLHCLAGVLVPDGGSVTYRPAGRSPMETSALGEPKRARLRLTDFGFVFQFGQLLPELTAVDNVSIPLLLAGTRRAGGAAPVQRICWTAWVWTGLGAKLPGELSGGQAQRVAVARALVTSPAVLFADEPTGSLDSLASENVLTLMLELVREAGTTVVMITHDARTAAYADREVIVRDGANRRRLPGVRVNPGLLKLAVVGSRSAYGRLAGIAGGVAVGVCLLLLLWGGANGLSARDDRGAWLRETGRPAMSVPVAAGDPPLRDRQHRCR